MGNRNRVKAETVRKHALLLLSAPLHSLLACS